MAFGRKKKDAVAADGESTGSVAADAAPVATPAERGPTTGPYDVADLPDDDETHRIDLGGLHIRMSEGLELRVDGDAEGNVASVTIVHGASRLQVAAFGAPKTVGIWAEVRGEITENLRVEGHDTREVDGPFGIELHGRINGPNPGQTQPARFLGVDGPRWFVRGLLTGPAATDPAQSTALFETFRGLVVVRGTQALAPRDMIPLHLPREAMEARAAQEAADAENAPPPQASDFNPFQRGPEITQIH